MYTWDFEPSATLMALKDVFVIHFYAVLTEAVIPYANFFYMVICK